MIPIDIQVSRSKVKVKGQAYSSYAEFNKSDGPAGHQVRILWGPAEIYTLPVRMSDTIYLQ